MTGKAGTEGFTDAEWAVWEPLIEAVRLRGQTPPKELRRTLAAIFWRHRNGTTWRAIPTELGPWWLAARLFIGWAKQGVWEHLLELAQGHAGGLQLGLAFLLDGTSIRAHAKAAGAPKKGELRKAETRVKPGAFASRSAGLVALAAASVSRRNRRVCAGTGPGARGAAGACVAGRPAGRARLGGGRPRPVLGALARANAGHGRAARNPRKTQRGQRALPRLHLHPPQPRRT